MEPLSKASLNNQIVSMRHIVRKSKVHTINKLSREAKKLKEKKGSDEQIEKNKKKAERFVNELMAIKKLNDDAVTKYALQNEIPASKILNSVDVTLETRARARLAGHMFISDAVQSFRNKYPDWKCSITDLLNDLGAKYRAKKKKPNEKKTVKVKTDKKPKVLKNNDDTVTDIKEFKNNQSESENATESEGYETDSNKSEENIQSDDGLVEKLPSSENNTSSEEDQSIELKPIIPNTVIETKEKNKNLSKYNTKATPLQVDKLQETNDLDSEIPTLVNMKLAAKSQKPLSNTSVVQSELELNKKTVKRKSELNTPCRVDNKKKRNMTDEVTPICETIDSFFMTADDKDYMSVYKPPPVVQKDTEERTKLEFSKPIKKDIFIKGKKVVVGKQNHVGNRRERRQQQVEEPVDTVLHPSWEAKRKQKSLAKFEGKKITFDDED